MIVAPTRNIGNITIVAWLVISLCPTNWLVWASGVLPGAEPQFATCVLVGASAFLYRNRLPHQLRRVVVDVLAIIPSRLAILSSARCSTAAA